MINEKTKCKVERNFTLIYLIITIGSYSQPLKDPLLIVIVIYFG